MSGGRRSWSTADALASMLAARLPVIDRKASPSFTALSCMYRTYSRRPIRRQLVRLLGQLRVPGGECLVLGPFTGEVGIQGGDPLLEADFGRQELLPIKAPLDLVGLQCVPVFGHHPELLAKSRHIG